MAKSKKPLLFPPQISNQRHAPHGIRLFEICHIDLETGKFIVEMKNEPASHKRKNSFSRGGRYNVLGPDSAPNPCSYCNMPATTIDHIAHLTLCHDPNHPQNLAPTCEKCNNEKGCKSVLFFMLKRRWEK